MTDRQELEALAQRLELHTKELANQPLNMTMGDWSQLSNDILGAASALRTARPAADREEVARKICEHIYGPLTWDRPVEEGTRNLCRGAADAILSLRATTADAQEGE